MLFILNVAELPILQQNLYVLTQDYSCGVSVAPIGDVVQNTCGAYIYAEKANKCSLLAGKCTDNGYLCKKISRDLQG